MVQEFPLTNFNLPEDGPVIDPGGEKEAYQRRIKSTYATVWKKHIHRQPVHDRRNAYGSSLLYP